MVIIAGLVFLYIFGWFLFARHKNRTDFVDVAWGFGFILIAWASMILGTPNLNGLIVNSLVSIWAVRLGLHIYARHQKQAEDFRYKGFGNIFTQVFLLQGCIMYIVALPIMWINFYPLSTPVYGAILTWISGFILEAIADRELAAFKSDPLNRGKLLTSGTWSCVRHPNYLGELMQWWAIWLMALPLPYGWATVVSPLLLTFLIVKVSGIKPLEEKMKQNPDFAAYAEKTPMLIPYKR